MRRFLTELISSPKFTFDISDAKGRVAVAVLLDKVQTRANDACLEILGMRSDADQRSVFSQTLDWAQRVCPKDRSGIQIGVTQPFEFQSELTVRNFRFYYETVKMRCENWSEFSPHSSISLAIDSDGDEIYQVLCASFAENPETGIPDVETWRSHFGKDPTSRYFIWREAERILGFLQLVVRKTYTEINTIGVLETARGRGVGRELIKQGLKASAPLTTCELTVAVKNNTALKLYEGLGFGAIERSECHRLDVGHDI